MFKCLMLLSLSLSCPNKNEMNWIELNEQVWCARPLHYWCSSRAPLAAGSQSSYRTRSHWRATRLIIFGKPPYLEALLHQCLLSRSLFSSDNGLRTVPASKVKQQVIGFRILLRSRGSLERSTTDESRHWGSGYIQVSSKDSLKLFSQHLDCPEYTFTLLCHGCSIRCKIWRHADR